MKAPTDWQTARLHSSRNLSPTVREFILHPEAPVQRWTPGSHIQVRLQQGDGVLERSYSLVGLPDDGQAQGGYRIAVKRATTSRGGSHAMHALQDGASLDILPPANHFELSFAPPQHLLLAGGIGITPMLGMAQALAARGADLRMAYAARSQAELVYADTLAEALGGRLQCLSSDQSQRLDLPALIAALHPQGQLLLCGPLSLLQAAQAVWADAGRPPELLRFETFGAGAIQAQPFWVELPRHGLRLLVPAERTLLQVLADAGVETLSDCERGECGLCTMTVLGVQGQIDHRDVFLSPAERAAGQRLCACVSRVCADAADGREAVLVLDSDFRPDPGE